MAVDSSLRIRTKDSMKYVKDGWVEIDKFPADLPAPIRQWIDSILYGKEVRFGLQEGRQLTELMENAYIADKEKREVAFAR